ncbi:MAG: ABC transporter substrate-binding protein, partial [Treponema sp.]|jgi:iron complex transport system substrate-binding protein|nr:ABC transporter substrate-binding protein [Treponema sp.]
VVLVFGISAVYAEEMPGFPINLTDILGRPLTLKAPPRRIVSLSPAITEILFAIGAGEQVVGVTQYCNYPAEAQSRTTVGGFSGATVSVEQIAVLKPDVVFLSGFMHERIITLLERLSIPTFAVEPRNFDGVYQTIATLGRLTGHDREAGEVVTVMQAKINRAGERSKGRERPGVFWELIDEPLITAGGNTFINEAIRLGGGRNIFEDLTEEYPVVNTEQVLLRRPAWIIAGNDHGKIIDPEALSRRPGWQRIPAVRDGHIALVNADTLYRYGPRLADAVLAISEIIWGKT